MAERRAVEFFEFLRMPRTTVRRWGTADVHMSAEAHVSIGWRPNGSWWVTDTRDSQGAWIFTAPTSAEARDAAQALADELMADDWPMRASRSGIAGRIIHGRHGTVTVGPLELVQVRPGEHGGQHRHTAAVDPDFSAAHPSGDPHPPTALGPDSLEGFQLPRVTMLETEYLRAVTQAELNWIDDVLAGLRDGTITWSREQLQAVAAQWTGQAR